MMKIKIEDLQFRSPLKSLLIKTYFILLIFLSSCSSVNEVVKIINGNSVLLSSGVKVNLIDVANTRQNLTWLKDSLSYKKIILLNKDKEAIEDITSTEIEAYVYTEDGLFVNKTLSDLYKITNIKELETPRPTESDEIHNQVEVNNEKTESITVCSWNLKDLGRCKDDDEIDFIAEVIKKFDVVAIQEVVAGEGGPQAVARLSEALNRKGAKWNYTISPPTISSSYKTERYAYIWKPNKLKIVGNPWLEKKFGLEIDREPFLANFSAAGKTFTLVDFHAITKEKQPEREIKYLKYFPEEYSSSNLIFVGDFNCPQSNNVFNPLKKLGYPSVLINQKTSLKLECNQMNCLASELDNMFYDEKKVSPISSGIIPFYQIFPSLKEAREISDHVPIFLNFAIN